MIWFRFYSYFSKGKKNDRGVTLLRANMSLNNLIGQFWNILDLSGICQTLGEANGIYPKIP